MKNEKNDFLKFSLHIHVATLPDNNLPNRPFDAFVV